MSKPKRVIEADLDKTRYRMENDYTTTEREELAIFMVQLFELASWAVGYDFEDSISYRLDDKWAPYSPELNCSDTFVWGSCDGEEVTPENIHILQKVCEDIWEAMPDDVGVVDQVRSQYSIGDLFAARIRKLRPQGARYSSVPKFLWPLFNDCGPYREPDMGNPYEIGEYRKGEPPAIGKPTTVDKALDSKIYCADTHEVEPLRTALERMDEDWIEEYDCQQMSIDLIDALKHLLPKEKK